MMRSLASALVLVLASGCGGAGTGSTDTRGHETTSISTTAPTSPPTNELDSTTVVEVTEATPWEVELADPTGPRLHDWAKNPTRRPPEADAPDGVDTALTWIYVGLIELWRDDDRVPALRMSEVALGGSHREVAPGTTIDILGSAAALLADSYAIITDRASAAVPGSPGEPLFAAWSEYAARSTGAAERRRSTLADARSLPFEDQACFLAVVDGDAGCGGVGAGLAAVLLTDAETDARAIDEVGVDDLGISSAFGVELDECAAWDHAVSTTGLTDNEELKLWLAIDGHELDVKFAARSECHLDREGVDDAAADEIADRAAFRDYLEAVAGAVVETGYDEVSAEFRHGAEDERREYDYRSASATTLVVDVARDVASRTWTLVDDAVLATTLYEVVDLEFDDWVELAWHKVAWNEVQVCDVWTEVLAELQTDLGDDEMSVFAVAVPELGIAGTLVPDLCD